MTNNFRSYFILNYRQVTSITSSVQQYNTRFPEVDLNSSSEVWQHKDFFLFQQSNKSLQLVNLHSYS